MSRSVTCKISGKTFNFATEYFQKRVEEYSNKDTLEKYYVTKKVKSFIIRGYSVQEIRNILNIEGNDLLPVDSQEIKDIMIYHTVRESTSSKKKNNNFATHKSDHDVITFINNIKDLNYDEEIYSANRK